MQDKTKARNYHYREIVRGLKMDPSWKQYPNPDVVMAYHHVFWMGDLNYR